MSNSQNSLLLVREKKSWRQLWWIFAIIGGSVFLDQLTKYLAVVFLQGEPSFPIIEDVIHFTFVKNPGAAFGMLKDHRWVFMVVSTVAIAALIVYLVAFHQESRWMQASLAMIIGGGIGNMIDRVALGYVVDFIDVRAIDFYVFNVADSFVCVGCGMILVWTLYMEFVAKKPAMDILLGTDKKEEAPAGTSTGTATGAAADTQAEENTAGENNHAE